MMRKTVCFIIMLMWCAPLWAAEITQEQLVGEWEFTHWAEKANKEQKEIVGVVMDFRSDGTVISKLSGPTGYQRGTYEVNGDTIVYSDNSGEQIWKVETFKPDKKLVVIHKDAIMFFEKVES